MNDDQELKTVRLERTSRGRSALVLSSPFDPRGLAKEPDGIFIGTRPTETVFGQARLVLPDVSRFAERLFRALELLLRGEEIVLHDEDDGGGPTVRVVRFGDLIRFSVGDVEWMQALACEVLPALFALTAEPSPSATMLWDEFRRAHEDAVIEALQHVQTALTTLQANKWPRAMHQSFGTYVAYFREGEEKLRLASECKALEAHWEEVARGHAPVPAGATVPVVFVESLPAEATLSRDMPDRHGECPFIDLGEEGVIIGRYVEQWVPPHVTSLGTWIRRWSFWLGDVEFACVDRSGASVVLAPPEDGQRLRAVPLGDRRFQVTFESSTYTHVGSARSTVTLTVLLDERRIVHRTDDLSVSID